MTRNRRNIPTRQRPSPGRGDPAVRWRRLVRVVGLTLTLLGVTIGPAAAADFGPLEPVALVTATPTTGTAPLLVTFDGSGSLGPNPLASWTWTFGDGAAGSGVVVSHTYNAPGTYAASLIVADGFGLISLPRTVLITVAAPTAPAAPTGLTATALSRSSIGLAWTNAIDLQTSVRIERCKGAGCTRFSLVATLPGSATTFADTRLASATTYTYRVRAANAVGPSPWSDLASARTLR